MAEYAESRNDKGNGTHCPSRLVSLESILCTEELRRRPSRPPDYEKENRALGTLAQALADSPHTILQTLTDTILDILQAGSAGVSLLSKEDGGKRFYWPAIAGSWKQYIGGGTPRDFGPCGDVLDRNTPLLFTHIERRYTYFQPVKPPGQEALLVPFYIRDNAAGTIWAVAHNSRKFDAEDERIMISLGKFTSSAYQAVVSVDALKFQVAEREKAEIQLRESEERLRTVADGLETQVHVRTQELERRNVEFLLQTEQLRELSKRLLQTQDEERRRIARDLHDSAGQIVTALGVILASVVQRAEPETSKTVEECRQLVLQLSKEIRTVSYLLHPPLLDEDGLSGAIGWYLMGLAERSGLTIELDIPKDFGRLPDEMEVAIFRIVQECLTNIHRHSGGSTATIRLSRDTATVSLEIQDDGKGISGEKLGAIRTRRSGVGITGMRERVRHLGGTLDVQSNSTGTTISAAFPI